jgi:hypothetical protein
LEANEHYLANLDGTGDIRELHPSEHNRQIERIRFFDRMRRIRKTAEQESIFLSLVRRSVILYGRRSITYIENPGGNRRPVEMELKTHSASMEFPRMEIVDPIGLSYMMLVFRTERPSS